jgi:hypothetical protein
MDEDKVDTFRNWSREEKLANRLLNNLFEVQQFLGLCNDYRTFIKVYSEVAEPYTRLPKKHVWFEWLEDQQQTCEEMIMRFTTATIVPHFDHPMAVIVETVASDYVSAGVLSQKDNEGVLLQVAYLLKTHTTAEGN